MRRVARRVKAKRAARAPRPWLHRGVAGAIIRRGASNRLARWIGDSAAREAGVERRPTFIQRRGTTMRLLTTTAGLLTVSALWANAASAQNPAPQPAGAASP